MNSFNEEAQHLKNKIEDILRKHDITPQDNIFYGEKHGDGSLEINIKKDSDGWHWWDVERGRIHRDKITIDEDEIIYWIIKQSTRGEASNGIDRTSRSKRKNPRKTFFNHHIKIMNKINPDWAKKLKSEYDQYLNE